MMVIDIVALVILLLFFLYGLWRGLLRMVIPLLVFVLSFTALYVGFRPAYTALQDVEPYIAVETSVSAQIRPYVEDRLTLDEGDTTAAVSGLKFPKPLSAFLISYCDKMNAVIEEDAVTTVTSALTEFTMRAILGLALFLTALILLIIIAAIITALAKLPVLHGTNKLLGGLLGLLNGLLFLSVICFIIMALPIGQLIDVQQFMEGSIFKTVLYDHNLFSYLIPLIPIK